ncbi:hypothetical protein [Mesorhizobium sp. M0802]|uniref:hypothetical protein n=1 Tax=Mesorhizobium sp. M0802 TaxID=2957001 RepID=UPI00333C762B
MVVQIGNDEIALCSRVPDVGQVYGRAPLVDFYQTAEIGGLREDGSVEIDLRAGRRLNRVLRLRIVGQFEGGALQLSAQPCQSAEMSVRHPYLADGVQTIDAGPSRPEGRAVFGIHVGRAGTCIHRKKRDVARAQPAAPGFLASVSSAPMPACRTPRPSTSSSVERIPPAPKPFDAHIYAARAANSAWRASGFRWV